MDIARLLEALERIYAARGIELVIRARKDAEKEDENKKEEGLRR